VPSPIFLRGPRTFHWSIAAELPIFAPAQEEAILREAGFWDVSLFYVGFAFRGRVAYAKHP
jgi:tRNA (cmo5U34)-methyltransferase